MVLLDSGNLADNPNEEGDIRTAALLEAMARLGYKVVNVGERDLALGYDAFRKRTEGLSMAFVSANVVRQGTQEPVFDPYHVLEVPRGAGGPPLRVAVIGATRFSAVWQKAGPAGTNLALAPPREMVKKYAAEARSKADIVILLAALSRDEAGAVVREARDVDFVFGAYGGIISNVDETEGRTRLVYVGNQGRYIGETRVFLGAGANETSSISYLHNLTARYPEDEAMQRWVGDVNKKISALRPPAGQARPAAAAPGSAPR